MSSWQHVTYGLCLKCRRFRKFTPVVGVRISERGREITSRTFGMFSLYLSYPYVNWFIVQGYLFNGYFEREQGEPFPFPLLEHFSSGYHPRQSPTSATQFPIHSEKDLSNVNANPDRGTVSKLLRLPARTVPRLISLWSFGLTSVETVGQSACASGCSLPCTLLCSICFGTAALRIWLND